MEEVKRVRDASLEYMVSLVERLRREGLECPTWGIGSTPSCSHPTDKFSEMTELHPGNYVFYDNQQLLLGSCSQADIAGKIITRVIGHYPRRGQMLVDCGFTAITKQGQGCQTEPAMVAPVEDHPEIMLSNMTQVRPTYNPQYYILHLSSLRRSASSSLQSRTSRLTLKCFPSEPSSLSSLTTLVPQVY